MTARDELIEAMRDPGFAYCPGRYVSLVADNILEHHAHELAEKIRACEGFGYPKTSDIYVGADLAADEIDPEEGK